jgi:tRNA(His) 5'-end guanylyltransferase
MATAIFNSLRRDKLAMFDSRVFQIPDRTEVENYFIWRQKDAVTNSIQSLAQSLHSHRELENKSCNQLQEMCFQKGSNWNDIKVGYKRGRLILQVPYYMNADYPEALKWEITDSPDFLKERHIFDIIPTRP